jgi:hypothetical protein
VGAIAEDCGSHDFDIASAGLEAWGCRGDPNQAAAGFQDLVGSDLDVAADGVKHHIAGGGLGEILVRVVDDLVGAEA